MTELNGAGLRVRLPSGWEGEISDGGLQTVADGATRPTVVHVANFPLPAGRGDFGSGAVERMRPGDVLVVLFEFGPEAVGSALFAARGIPRSVDSRDFDPGALQWGRPGMSGIQRFFTEGKRAFCLYIVLGSHLDRSDAIPQIEELLSGLEVG